MPDFTSALYLGLRHPSCSLPRWPALTLGKPAALEDPPGARAVETELAGLTGCEAVLLAPSTLHLVLDLFAVLGRPGTAIFLDIRSYPTMRWAAREAALAGSPSFLFDGLEPGSLEKALAEAPDERPLIVADGIHPATGTPAPLAEYISLAAKRGGLVVLDDTQSLGICGRSPHRFPPYGAGGGGSARRAGVVSKEIVMVSSLAKAFGVPVAMLGGSADIVGQFRARSWTRVHCSPPSVAVIAAASHALEENRRRGDALRALLAGNVARLRAGLQKLGLAASRSLFPVQPLNVPSGVAAALHERWAELGVKAVLHGNRQRPHVTCVVTANHSPEEIDSAIATLQDALETVAGKTRTGVTCEQSSELRSGVLRRVLR